MTSITFQTTNDDVANVDALTLRNVRRIWGSIDAISIIFAGSAAEFAVNRAVDWLFWTNALPNAPIERFFETVRFAQAIAFGSTEEVRAAIDGVNRAHAYVERSRGASIPAWAYRDVLFMLIAYGECAYDTVYGPMTTEERVGAFGWSVALGRELHIPDLPRTYADYQAQRQAHLQHNTAHTAWTDLLYASYRQHLGAWRYRALLDLQASIVPPRVAALLNLQRKRRVDVLLRNYQRLPRRRLLDTFAPVMMPRPYAAQLRGLERPVV